MKLVLCAFRIIRMASATVPSALSFLHPSSSSSSKSTVSVQISYSIQVSSWKKKKTIVNFHTHSLQTLSNRQRGLICRAEQEYKFPDPIPEFADAETEKFRTHLAGKLSKKDDVFGESVDEVVEICTKILNEFLHTEYGGPGTLLVLPFIDMADALNDRGLPGGPQAARVAVKWAEKHVDKDWKQWTAAD